MRFLTYIFLGLFILMAWQTAEAQKRGGLNVFIENAEQDEIIAATVQVMDGEQQVSGGITDFSGFLYLPNIYEGVYDVVIRHIAIGSDTFKTEVEANRISELRAKLKIDGDFLLTVFPYGGQLIDTSNGISKSPRIGCDHCYPNIPENLIRSHIPEAITVDPLLNLKGGLKVFAIDENGNAFFGAHVEVKLIKLNIDSSVENGNRFLLERFSIHAVTDVNGLAHKDLPAGNYKVSVSHVSLGGVRTFDITIEPHATYELKLEKALYTELPAFVISAGGDCRVPFFDPYGQEKPRRSNIYFEMPPINK